jgi:nucleoside-diphosphate-sugar epimerase
MKLLVTGATGLLGNNIVRQLLAEGHSVRVLARPTADPRPLAGLNVETVAGDVRDPVAAKHACQGIDAVIHAAGYVHIGWRQADVHRAINVEGTRNVAAAAREAGAKLVHVSTVNALGLGRLENPADEESALPGIVPVPYVTTKREAELNVLEEIGRGLWGVIVNPATMFGPWDWKPSSGKMLLEVTRRSLIAPVGNASFCDVRDVATAVVAAIDKGQSGRRYILAGHNLPYREAWRQIAALVGKRGPLFPMGPMFRAIATPVCDTWTLLTGVEGPANSAALAMSRQSHCFSSARAQAVLGYQIRPLNETLRDAWQWFLEHGYVAPKSPTQ